MSLKGTFFGEKPKKRLQQEAPHQPLLSGLMGEPVPSLSEVEKQTFIYQRGKAKKQRTDDRVTDSGLCV